METHSPGSTNQSLKSRRKSYKFLPNPIDRHSKYALPPLDGVACSALSQPILDKQRVGGAYKGRSVEPKAHSVPAFKISTSKKMEQPSSQAVKKKMEEKKKEAEEVLAPLDRAEIQAAAGDAASQAMAGRTPLLASNTAFPPRPTWENPNGESSFSSAPKQTDDESILSSVSNLQQVSIQGPADPKDLQSMSVGPSDSLAKTRGKTQPENFPGEVVYQSQETPKRNATQVHFKGPFQGHLRHYANTYSEVVKHGFVEEPNTYSQTPAFEHKTPSEWEWENPRDSEPQKKQHEVVAQEKTKLMLDGRSRNYETALLPAANAQKSPSPSLLYFYPPKGQMIHAQALPNSASYYTQSSLEPQASTSVYEWSKGPTEYPTEGETFCTPKGKLNQIQVQTAQPNFKPRDNLKFMESDQNELFETPIGKYTEPIVREEKRRIFTTGVLDK